METHKRNGEPTPYGFSCGYTLTIRRRAGAATIYREHGAYIVRRAATAEWPAANGGYSAVPCRTIGEARRIAAALAAGKPAERRGDR
jgi:hypothetical protein